MTPQATDSAFPASLSICQTDPATGQCSSTIGPSVTATIAAGATPTFVTASGSIAFNPALERIAVQFTDSSGRIRGSTSVAVETL